MRLIIDNFAKISKADIKVDGITVIAGENNTGKSTIGKILFSLFNAISEIDEKIAKQRIKEIEDSCRLLFRDYSMHSSPKSIFMRNSPMLARIIANQFDMELKKNNRLEKSDIYNIIHESVNKRINLDELEDIEWSTMLETMTDKIESIIGLSEKDITLEVVSRYFNNVFHNQINSLVGNSVDAKVQLEIKKKLIDLTFKNNECTSFSADIAILHNAIYIDNPFIIDSLSSYFDLNTMDEYLRDLLTNDFKDDIMDGIIESVLVKEKLSEVYKALQNVVDGQIIEKQDNEYYYQRDGFSKPVYFNNLSTGIKSFIILKMLLEKNILKEKDIIILDEPEIHLHPQWQVAYAELIVLLQKHFDLSIIVATHSPYFLDAINLFSVKHGIDNKVNYYLSSMDNDNQVQMERVTDNIDLIYKKMASPIQILDSLRYELNNK
ncbi:MAG: AAA family ATPase [Clostridiaceae bacterium]